MDIITPNSPSSPIIFRGQSYSSPKRFRTGTHRSRAPEETIGIASTYFEAAGVTRLADITGLDRIGIPVILSFRPNGKTLSVSAGKGVSIPAASASAAMEAIEIYQAEYFMLASTHASWNEIVRTSMIIPAHLLPLTKNALFSTEWRYRWCFGWDIVAQQEIAVPQNLVNLGRIDLKLGEMGAFQSNSNGLTSGNDFLEALTSGLLEVIERDALTMTQLPWEAGLVKPAQIRTDSISDPMLRDLLDRIAAAQTEILLFDCQVDTGIPVFTAVLRDLDDPSIGLYRGHGAHLDPVIAASRAITEAIQGRAVYIAGSRDELFKQSHFHSRQTFPKTVVATLLRDSVLTDWSYDEGEGTDSFEGDVAVILDKLKKVGLTSVIVHDLTGDCPLPVLKVIVPGAEGIVTEWYAPGPRVKARMKQLGA